MKQNIYDTRSLVTHMNNLKWLYSAAGGGYFGSFDYGELWNSPTKGLT